MFSFLTELRAQTCSGGTTTITNQRIGQTTVGSNNTCIVLTSSGWILSSANGIAINAGVTGTEIENRGSIELNFWGYSGINNSGELVSLTNYGRIRNTQYGSFTSLGNGFFNSGTVGLITNSGTIAHEPTYYYASLKGNGIYNINVINTINNSGTIKGHFGDPGAGIWNPGGTISNVTNYTNGLITGYFGIRNAASAASVISTLTNSGTIRGTNYDIINNGTIGIFNNAQGAGSADGAVTHYNFLPTRYNIIVNSNSSFGRLAVNSANGSTTFGIYAGGVSGVAASVLTAGTYTSVLTGVAPANVTGSTAGTYGSYAWSLNNIGGTTWDLIVTGSGSSSSNSSSAYINNLSIIAGMRVYLANAGSNPIFNGGTLVLLTADSSSVPFLVNTLGGIIESPDTGTATLSGIFSGVGGLTFTGSGTTLTSGANTYTGGTTVSSGTLSIQGNSPTGFGDVFVGSSGTLMGTGTINGRLTVAGTLKPGHSPGYLTTTNTVTMNTGSTYQQDIAGAVAATSATPIGATGYYSVLGITGGQLIINPGAILRPRLSNLFSPSESGYGSAIYVPALGDRFRVVTADGGISGRFSTVSQPAELAAGTQFLPFYNMAGSNSLDLAVIPTSYRTTLASFSGNQNAQSVGAALDQMVSAAQAASSSSTQDELLYATSNQTAALLPGYTQSLAGEIYPATVAVIAQTTQRVQQAVQMRLGDAMGLGLPNSMNGPTSNTAAMGSTNALLSGGVPTAAVSSNPGLNPAADAASFSNGNVWGELAYQRGRRNSDSYSGGWTNNLYQLAFGSDFYTERGVRLGGGFALSSTTLNPSYGSGTIQQGSLFAYGKMPIDAYVFDAIASVGLNASDISRSDASGLASGFRNKNISGNDAMLSLGVSRPIVLQDIRLTPFARLTWQLVTQSGVNEGASGAALTVERYTGQGVRGVLGVAAGSKTNNPLTEDFTYRAYVGLGADSSGLLNPTLNASLAGLSTNITTPKAGTTFVQAGLYGTAKFADNAYAYAGISGEARAGQTLGTVNLGIRVQF